MRGQLPRQGLTIERGNVVRVNKGKIRRQVADKGEADAPLELARAEHVVQLTVDIEPFVAMVAPVVRDKLQRPSSIPSSKPAPIEASGIGTVTDYEPGRPQMPLPDRKLSEPLADQYGGVGNIVRPDKFVI